MWIYGAKNAHISFKKIGNNYSKSYSIFQNCKIIKIDLEKTTRNKCHQTYILKNVYIKKKKKLMSANFYTVV